MLPQHGSATGNPVSIAVGIAGEFGAAATFSKIVIPNRYDMIDPITIARKTLQRLKNLRASILLTQRLPV